MTVRFPNVVPALVVAAGGVACAGGFIAHRMWTQLAWNRIAETLLLALISLLLAGVLRRWRGWSWASALALVWLAALMFFVSLRPGLATCLFAVAAMGLGSFLVPSTQHARAATALAIGLVMIAGIAGWLLLMPIHYALIYLAIFAAILIWRWPAIRALTRLTAQGWRDAVMAAPGAAAFAMLVLGLVSVGAWLPTMQADDLAYHLALPAQLQATGVYAPDPAMQIWALAPWLGDVVQGIAQVLAGREARGAVDTLWLAISATLLWRLTGALGGSARARWFAVALLASLPLLAMLVGGMQTELPATALVVALACVIVDEDNDRRVLAGAVLVAGLVALKLGHAVAALVLLAWALARAHGRVNGRHFGAAALLFVALAGSSYFHAWQMSGNPLLPLFNDLFRSPVLAPLQLTDTRWHAGFNAALPWSVTFDTGRYLEGWTGGFGFVLIALGGAWLLALLRIETRTIAVAASFVFFLPLLPMQYARYAFPGLVLLLAPLLVATDAALGESALRRLVVALCVLNLAFQANANWLLHVNAVRRLVTSGGRVDEVLRRYAPERVLIEQLRQRDGSDSIVLAMDAQTPYIAELGTRGRGVAHYAPALEAQRLRADADPSGAGWQALIRRVDAHWLLLRPAHLDAPMRAGLARVGARLVASVGLAQLWSVSDALAIPGASTR